MIIGINGIDNSVAIKIPEDTYYIVSDGDYEYPELIRENTTIHVAGHGAMLFTFGQLYYSTIGVIEGEDMMPMRTLIDSQLDASITKTLMSPLNEPSVNFDKIYNHSSSGLLYKYNYRIISTGASYGRAMGGYAGIVPLIYRWGLEAEKIMTSPSGSQFSLQTDIISYRERISEDTVGGVVSADANIEITCYDQYRDQIKANNAKIVIELGTDSGKVKRGVHYATEVQTVWNNFHEMSIILNTRDVIKRLQNNVVIESETYDKLNHVEIVEKLAKLAYVDLEHDSAADDPYMVLTEAGILPKWKFVKGATIWDCMSIMRKYSGWVLYPDRNGDLQYRKRPTQSSKSLRYTFSTAQNYGTKIPIRSINYYERDSYRTRILVIGTASEQADPTQGIGNHDDEWHYNNEKYNKHDLIAAVYFGFDLEDEIGESRVGIYIEPSLGNYAAVAWACNNIAKWYTQKHTYIEFFVSPAERILDLWLYDKIKIEDAKTGKSGYYQVSSLEFIADKTLISCKVTGKSWWE